MLLIFLNALCIQCMIFSTEMHTPSCTLYKRARSLFQILFVAASYEKTNVILRACKQKCTGNWPSSLRGGDELCRVISAVQVCRFAIMFLDTLCSKKWYSTIQWSTIPRIGRHSAGYN